MEIDIIPGDEKMTLIMRIFNAKDRGMTTINLHSLTERLTFIEEHLCYVYICYIIKECFFLYSFFVNYILSFSLVMLLTIRVS